MSKNKIFVGMKKRRKLSRNQRILLAGVVVAAIVGIIPLILFFLSPKRDRQGDIGKISGDGTVIGDNAQITIDKRQMGLDSKILLSRAFQIAEAKGRTDLENEQLQEEYAKALERIEQLESKGDRPDAEKALQELRENGNTTLLLKLLIEERDKSRDALIQRNSEIAAVAYIRGDIDIAESATNEVLALEPNNPIALNSLGRIYNLRGNLDEAEKTWFRVLEYGHKTNNEKHQAVAIGNLGVIYRKRGDFAKAEQMHQRSLELNRKLGWLEGMANNYGNLGIVYLKQGDLTKSEEMIQQSIKIEKKLGRLESIANDYGNLGVIYETQGDLDKAEQMYQKSLEIDEKLGQLEGIAKSYTNLGVIHKKRGDLNKAEQMFLKSLKISDGLGGSEVIAINYFNLGAIYKQLSDDKRAAEYWEKALEIFEKIGMQPEIEEVKGLIEELRKKS